MNILSLFKQSNSKIPQTLILGEDAFLNDYLARKFVAQEQFKDFEHITLDCSEDGLDELMANLTESSLFDNQKIIIAKNPFFLTAKVAAKYKKDIEKLQVIIEHLNEIENIVVFVANYENIDRRKKISKALMKQVNVVETKLKPYEISGFLKALIKQEGYTITNQALQMLIQRSDQVLDTALANYLKLKNICDDDHKITESLIDRTIDRSLSENIFEILSAAFKGDYVQASKRLDDHLREGNNVVQLLAVFQNQLEFLMVVKVLQNRRWSQDQIVRELKANPYRIKFAMQNPVKLAKLKDLIKHSIELDFGYKNGTYHGNEFLKMFLLSI
ncbi:DNA polymerase III subunit delta [Lactobacillus hominis]|uniref:DNA polymerase III subunit delta n=1 Tax=Lactobacillus hominis DSM 23910 = CRBIP 24.179 TaxID=1423758 RepID=I7KG49_9LACO|nr:DNA polymerase III subunit delta [Lactobacillus hominis]KRM86107.1 DNA-directed DNA polymerase III delta subunit [Lactobacillus hominis DSM 23910 = CRBIP 24.179]MCT3348670.1 DNA polymerase III subunit delta [Lactobacillus hominis]CCI80935.1 DNA-directed DNA polymerase III delta subunit [Lactobacillus hominis DSM 23910 = CRBIP 24.179]